MLKSLTFISSASLILSSAYALSEPTAHWQQRQYIQNSFVQIALESEYGNSDRLLHKWQQPIFYTIVDRTADKTLHQNMITQQFKHLSIITEHQIAPATDNQTANVTIIFSSESQLDSELAQSLDISNDDVRSLLNRNSICVASLNYDKTASIRSAVVIIPVDRARAHAKLMACVVEELTQIMGLPNDSTTVYPSIFNDYSFNDFLTGLDYLLLRLLYNPSLKAGMSVTDVQEKLLEITQTNEYNDVINQAELLVRQHSLELWLD